MKSSLAYDKCRLYLDWMETMDVITSEIDEEGFRVITLSDKGNELYVTQFENTEDNKFVLLN